MWVSLLVTTCSFGSKCWHMTACTCQHVFKFQNRKKIQFYPLANPTILDNFWTKHPNKQDFHIEHIYITNYRPFSLFTLYCAPESHINESRFLSLILEWHLYKLKTQVKLTVNSKSKKWFLDRRLLLRLWSNASEDMHVCAICSKSFLDKNVCQLYKWKWKPPAVLTRVHLQHVYIWRSEEFLSYTGGLYLKRGLLTDY